MHESKFRGPPFDYAGATAGAVQTLQAPAFSSSSRGFLLFVFARNHGLSEQDHTVNIHQSFRIEAER
jgi:hypothetical protein